MIAADFRHLVTNVISTRLHDAVACSLTSIDESLFIDGHNAIACETYFCNYILDKVFKDLKPVAISDVERYGQRSNQNGFYKSLKEKLEH